MAWWTKWTKGHVRAALDAVGAVAVTADNGDGWQTPAWVAAGRSRRHAGPAGEPVSLLPGLDPTIMGWKERGWYLGPHRAPLFDSNGNAGPTVWVGGRAVGAWSQLEGGTVVTRLLEDVDAATAMRVDEAAERLTEWMGGVARDATVLDATRAGARCRPGVVPPSGRDSFHRQSGRDVSRNPRRTHPDTDRAQMGRCVRSR